MSVTNIDLFMHLYFKRRNIREISNGQPRYTNNIRYTRHWTNTKKNEKKPHNTGKQDRYNMYPVNYLFKHLKRRGVFHVTTKY